MLNHPQLPGTVVVVVVVIYSMKMTKKIAEYVLYVGERRQVVGQLCIAGELVR